MNKINSLEISKPVLRLKSPGIELKRLLILGGRAFNVDIKRMNTRLIRAMEHWRVNTDLTLAALIVRTVKGGFPGGEIP